MQINFTISLARPIVILSLALVLGSCTAGNSVSMYFPKSFLNFCGGGASELTSYPHGSGTNWQGDQNG